MPDIAHRPPSQSGFYPSQTMSELMSALSLPSGLPVTKRKVTHSRPPGISVCMNDYVGASLDEMSNCPDCGVSVGELHDRGCGIARCRMHGQQWMFCSGEGDHASTTYQGVFPGTAEAMAREWYVKRDPEGRFIQCGADDGEGILDINRVYTELTWDPSSEGFI